MSEDQVQPYEGMFLFPQAQAGELQAAVDHIEEVLRRAEAELISLQKWDERRLAYEIKGNKRGVYFLAYFKVKPSALTGIERDCNLSERMLRSIILRAEHIPLEVMEAADGREALNDEIRLRGEQAEKAEAEKAQKAEKPDSEPTETDPVEVKVESVSTDATTPVEG